MVDTYVLHFDGSCGPNNPGGTAAYGFVLEKFGDVVESGHGIIGSGKGMTNNLAEHYAVAQGFQSFLNNFSGGQAILLVRGDSQLVVKQLNKEYGAKSEKPYYTQYVRATGLLKDIRKQGVTVNIDWIPRHKNTICDDLSKVHLKNTT